MPSDRPPRCRVIGVLLAAAVLAGCAGTPSREANRAGDTAAPDAGRFAGLAAESFDRGQYGAAARFYREAAEARPDAAEPRLGLGRALMRLRKPREAVSAFRAAVERADDAKTARIGLGRALTAADQPGEAVRVLDTLLESHPDAAGAHLARGVALDLQGDHAAAQASYRAGLADAPEDVALRNNLGLSKVLAGDVESGIAILTEAAQRPDAGARTRQNLALAHGLSGNMTKAADIARRDLDSQGVQRNLSYYETLHAVWRNDGDRGGKAAAEAVLDPARVSRSVAGPSAGEAKVTARQPRATPEPPKPAAKPEPPRRAQPVAPPADGGPIHLAAAVGVAAGDPGLTVAEAAPAEGDAPDSLAGRIIDARASLAEGTERDSESHWIQLASLKTPGRAATAKRRIRREFPRLADVIPLSLHGARLSRTKRVHRLRAGPFTGGDAAAALCRALRDRGQGCLVVRNEP